MKYESKSELKTNELKTNELKTNELKTRELETLVKSEMNPGSVRPLSERINSEWGIVLLRLVIGVVFVMHGGQKLFVYGIGGVTDVMAQIGLPLPYLSAILATVTELMGGIALIAGAGTRLAALGLSFTMLVATVTVRLGSGFFLPNGFEYVLTLLVASAALVLTGAGPFSVDATLRARRTVTLEGVQA